MHAVRRGRSHGGYGVSPRGRRASLAAAAIFLPLSVAAAIAGPAAGSGASSGGSVTYTATVTVPVPSANFSGAAGGDGWGLAFTATEVFNVFHHDGTIEVNCHVQSTSANCWSAPKQITDPGTGDTYSTSGQPGLYLNPSSGHLYVFATRNADDTGGVVCIDTTQPASDSDPFCGFTALTNAGDAPEPPAWSNVSNPVQVGSDLYSFNYVNGTPSGTQDELMCFDVATASECAGAPYPVTLGVGSVGDNTSPEPSIATFGGEIEIPVTNGDSGITELACFDPATLSAGGTCPGTWPVSSGVSNYAGYYGSAFPLLSSSGSLQGFCLPVNSSGTDPCFSLDGAGVSGSSNLAGDLPSTSPWNGPAVVVEGTLVFLANQDGNHEVFCHDYSTGGECANFPKSLSNIDNGPYTVNFDPFLPTCVWINSDSGSAQIQNFDALTGGACVPRSVTLQSTGFVAPSPQCVPAQWTSLSVTSPAASTYQGGSVEFDDPSGNPLSVSPNPATLVQSGSANTVDLTGYDFGSVLPQFQVTMDAPPADLSSVTITATWTGADDPACHIVTLAGPGGSAPATSQQTLTTTVVNSGTPIDGAVVTLTCVSGPSCSTVPSAEVTTDAAGAATFTYTGVAPGTDVWQATSTIAGVTETSETADVVWTKTATTESLIVLDGAGHQWGTSSSTEVTGATAQFSGALPDPQTSAPNPPVPTGTITYEYFSNSSCVGSPAVSQTVTIQGATVPDSSPVGPLGGGSYGAIAVYSGDTDYTGSQSACDPFTVSPATPTVGQQLAAGGVNCVSGNCGTTGSQLTDTATVTGVNGFVPTGSVVYVLFPGSSCEGSPTQTSTVLMSGKSTTAPVSAGTAPLSAGPYAFEAVYSGDSNYAPVSSCSTFTVGKAGTTTSEVVDDAATNGPWLGTEATNAKAYDTSTVSTGVPTIPPTGSVVYDFYAGNACSGTPVATSTGTITSGVPGSSAATSALTAGTYRFQASYQGDSNYTGSSSGCVPFTVAKSPQTVGGAPYDANARGPWNFQELTGASAYDTSTVPATGSDSVTPQGQVTYSFYGNANCSGDPTWTQAETLTEAGSVPDSPATGPLGAGYYSFRPVYGGDANYLGGTGACEEFSVLQATPTVSQAVDDAVTGDAWGTTPEVTGAPAVDTSSVTGVENFTPSGSVTYDFYTGDGCSGTPAESDNVVLSAGDAGPSPSTGGLAAGTYFFRAVYSGDQNYLAASSACTQFVVGKASVSLGQVVSDVPAAGPEQTGSQAFDTATLGGTVAGFVPSGTVTYYLFSVSGCDAEVPGQRVTLNADGTVPASPTSAPLAAGDYSYLAVYSGDPNYTSAESTCRDFTVAPETPYVGEQVDDAATGSFWTGYEVTGASGFAAASIIGVTGFAPTGTLTYRFFDGGACTGDPAATFAVGLGEGGAVPDSGDFGPLPVGDYSVAATYSGDSNYAPVSSACQFFAVLPAPTATAGVVYDAATHAMWTDTELQGAAAYDTATVTGVAGFAPSGTVTYTFYENATCSGTPTSSQTVVLASGVAPASADTAGLPPGRFSYVATYSGGRDYQGSASACQPFKARDIGYRLEGGDGGLFAFHATYTGSVGFPSPPGLGLHIFNFVGMAPAKNGYWMVQSTGGIFRFGTAADHGSLPSDGIRVDNIVGIAATPDFGGYWMVSSTGAVYSFGDAHFHGSLTSLGLVSSDIVGIVSHDAGGYWLFSSTGGIYAFGDAKYRGGCAQAGSGCRGVANVVGMASPDAGGYWLATSTGGVFSFGDVHFHGSCPSAAAGCSRVADIVGIAAPDDDGYWLAGADGGVYHFGDAQYFGNEIGTDLVRPIVAIT